MGTLLYLFGERTRDWTRRRLAIVAETHPDFTQLTPAEPGKPAGALQCRVAKRGAAS